MVYFTIQTTDDSGRTGLLETNGTKIWTPEYVPNKAEFDCLENSRFVKDQDYKDINIGECVYWIDSDTLHKLKTNRETYKYLRRYLTSRIKSMDVPVNLLHFEFYNEVKSLDSQELKLLLNLQYDIGVSVIEIPNMFRYTWNYSDVIDKALTWKGNKGIETPLMGVACETMDIYELKNKLSSLIGVGIHLRRESFPMLYTVEEELKLEQTWIHGFSVPREYNRVRKLGTLGVLINTFGVDTISSVVRNPKGIRNFILSMEEKSPTEKEDTTRNMKYFNPKDYSTHTYEAIENSYGNKHKLSNFCNCPVCRNNTIGDILSNHNDASASTRSHEVLSHKTESTTIKRKIRNNELGDYIKTKRYAKQLVKKP